MRSVGSHVYGTGLGGPDCGPDRLPHIVRQPSQPVEGGRGRAGQVTWAARSNFHKRVASDGAAGTCTHWHGIYGSSGRGFHRRDTKHLLPTVPGLVDI